MSYPAFKIHYPEVMEIVNLSFPKDRNEISRLSLDDKQIWYAGQEPNQLLEVDDRFLRFWYWHYLVPLRIKRLVYVLKFW